MHPHETILTVSQLNRLTKMQIEQTFGRVQIEGEVSSLARPRSGHVYFQLKDAFSQIRCAWFNRGADSTRNTLQDGDHVVCQAMPSLYEARGEFQLIVHAVETAGEGALLRAFEALKEKLKIEGLFDAERKQNLPRVIRKIAIITSTTGAVIQDMLRSFAHHETPIDIVIVPSRVQGEGAAQELRSALKRAEKLKDVDAIVFARGGGSMEDLWCFNDESLVRAIFAAKKPIISAIGHETDFTLCDFVSDVRAHTPTAAAELIESEIDSVYTRLEQAWENLKNSIQERFFQLHQQLDRFRLQLKHPRERLIQQQRAVEMTKLRLLHDMTAKIREQRARYEQLKQSLHLLSPLNTLERGYAIVQDNKGVVVRDAHDVRGGELLDIRLARGVLRVEVV